MTTLEPSAAPAIDPATQIDAVALTVADLDRSVDFYTSAIGFALLQRSGDDHAILGVAETPLLLLTGLPGARPSLARATGLYHFAILVPKRADLSRWLRHFLTLGYGLPGQGDHLVSEALYLSDPDGNGIEVYRDRPRDSWHWVDGMVQMATDPVDISGLLHDADQSGEPWNGLPVGTIIGHMHLKVGDIGQAAAFYHGILGFEPVVRFPDALFVSAGRYHHHLGLNTWQSRGASPAPAGTAGLRFFTLALPTDEARAAVVSRIAGAGLAYHDIGIAVALHDPWKNAILMHVGTLSGNDAAAGLDVSFA